MHTSVEVSMDMTSSAIHARPTLDGLADEILLEILSHISIRNRYDIDFKTWDGSAEIESRVATLHSLSLVSRNIHRVANPLLYSVLTSCGIARNRRDFLRTAVRKAELAASVREVRFSYFDWVVDRSGIPPSHSDVLEAARLVELGPEMGITEKFHDALQEGFNDSDVALLFSQLPNLEMVEFEVDETWFHTWQWLLRLVRISAEMASGPFSSLRHLKARYGNENQSGFNPLFIQDWTALPSLTTIEVSGAWCDERDGDRPVTLPSNSNITTLSFHASALSNDYIGCALGAFPGLKSFCYDWARYATCSSENYPEGIRNALNIRKDSLERLHLLMLAGGGDFCLGAMDRGLSVPPFGSFKDLARLKCLEVSEFLLTGVTYVGIDIERPMLTGGSYSALVDVFPASLEVLRIGCRRFKHTSIPPGERLRFFEELLRHVAHLPHFRCLDLVLHEGTGVWRSQAPYEDYEDEIERIVELGHASDISFRVMAPEQWKQESSVLGKGC
ncbi:hypothetical protein MPH_05619 [Macrophomina phaseolina MS6]|uniref:F-box domain cyclin-like protein n=2 Tax=Macrophomina phaseolina TaxID=35725 RepID=K2SK31_MACPH|nr:hypothetical protein MPH_05619 [Macrophomina phaseolina MS6]KAH7049129.1 hypothetical protein B0J12DRAFT_95732 [Macrophomina phaseolina]